MRRAHSIHGVVATYDDPEELIVAAHKAQEAGYKHMDAYTPFPVHGLPDAIGFHEVKVPWVIFLCGLAGASIGILFQWYITVVDYPLNIGGRPLFSWPAYIPVTFECTILLAAFGAVFGMLGLNGLPKPYQSIFNTPGFERASQDKFFLSLEARDEDFDPVAARAFLESTGAEAVAEVEL